MTHLENECPGLAIVRRVAGDGRRYQDTGDGKPSRELLLVILADEEVKMGIVLVQMKKIASRIVDAIKTSAPDMNLLRLDELDVRTYLMGLI